MKPEYKLRVQESLDAIEKRSIIINEMLEGNRPADTTEAIRLTIEIKRLIEQTRSLIDIS